MYKKNHHPHEAPLVSMDGQGKRTRNPNEITVNQHVLPQAHLKEWIRPDGLLNVFDKQRSLWITPAPENAFTVQRLWDQWTETSFLGSNENNYQAQARLIKNLCPIECHEHISVYFLMLCIRAKVASNERPDYPSIMESAFQFPSQGELEEIELENVSSSAHISYPGGHGSQAGSRETVKFAMNTMFIAGAKAFKEVVWTPFSMTGEEAIFPDSFVEMHGKGFMMLPVTPKIVLIGASKKDLAVSSGESLTPAAINKALLDSSVKYYVASNQIAVL